GANMVALHAHPPCPAITIGDRPVASPLARIEAETTARVTTLLHRHVELDDFQTLLIPLLDGTRDRAALLTEFERLVAKGDLSLDHQGKPLQEASQVRELLIEGLDLHLRGLARRGLL